MDRLLSRRVNYMSDEEKDDTIVNIVKKVKEAEKQRDNYQQMAFQLDFTYQRIRELKEVQQRKANELEEENIKLLNKVNYMKYKLEQAQQQTLLSDDDLGEQQQQQSTDPPTGGYSNTNKGNGNMSSSIQNDNKNRRLSRQMSQHSNSSGGGSINIIRKQMEKVEIEQVEQIEWENTFKNERIEQNNSEYIIKNLHELKNNNQDSLKLKQSLSHIEEQEERQSRIKAKIGELLFQDFLLIGPSIEELGGIGQPQYLSMNSTTNLLMSSQTNGQAIQSAGNLLQSQNQNTNNQMININNNQAMNNSNTIGMQGQNALNQSLQSNQNYQKNNSEQASTGINDTGEEVTFQSSLLFDLIPGQLDESQREVVCKNAFPFKIKGKKYRLKKYESFMTEVYKNLFTENKVKHLQQFIFTIGGGQLIPQKNQPKPTFPPTLEASNPSKRQYCIYFVWEDYLFSQKEKQLLFKCPLVFCFISYYPFFGFFKEVLCHILSKLQKERIPLFNLHTKINSNSFLSLDASWIIQELLKDHSIYKKKLLDLQIMQPQVQQVLSFTLEDEEDEIEVSDNEDDEEDEDNYFDVDNNLNIMEGGNYKRVYKKDKMHGNKEVQERAIVSFMVPCRKQLPLLEISQHSGSSIILQLLTFEDFWFILNLIMLEQQIVFFSSSIQFISSALQTLSSIFKPFNTSTLIFHIFEGKFTLLETPPPFIGAINQNLKFIQSNRVITNDSVRVNFVDLDSRRFYLSQETIDLFKTGKAYMNYSKYQYEMRKAFSVLTHSQYSIQQNFEFNDHSYKKQSNDIIYRFPPSSSHLSFDISNKKHETEEEKLLNLQKAYSEHMNELKARALEEIQELLQETFHHYILAHLPREPTIDISSKQFSVSEFLEKILKKSEEKQFTSLFLQTLNFQYYFQLYYEHLWNSKHQNPLAVGTNSKVTLTNPSTAASKNN